MSDYSSTRSSDSWSSSESGSDDEETIQLLRKISKMDVNENKPNRFLGTGIVYHQIMTEHKCDWDTSYPEHPGRLTESYDRCRELGLVDRCLQIELHYAMEDQIMEVHSQDLLTTAQSTAMMSVEELKELAEKHDSWYSNNSTYEAALAAAGSAINLVDHVLDEKIDNGFALVRPPGHHAMHSEFNGYCTFNNVAIAAERALSRGVSRILIVDWDVHHGQGVQRHFYKDSRVLYFSIHRYEYGRFWPELRESDYDFIGKDNGLGYNINIPLNKNGMTNSDYMAVLHQVLLPVAYEFSPQLVLISSGYDAAIGCLEGEMLLTPSMYAHMVHHLMGLATGRVCAVLEGGYCVKSLAEGCAHTLRSLLQDPCPMLKALEEPSDSVISTILNVVKVLRPYWNCFAYHQLLLPNESCQFPEVSSVPPLPGVEFSTPENRPEKFEILHNYPTQSAETIQHYSALIDDLIKETDLSVAADRCCYVFDPDMRAHKNLDLGSHPERPDRISRIYAKLAEQGLLKRCLEVESRLARKEELLLIHSESHITAMQETQRMSEKELSRLPLERLYISIYLHQRTMHCALLSCGSLLNVVEAVMTKQAQSGVAIIRPPGHHAESHCAMGFCIFNNVGIAAKFAQKHFNVKRVLIVDWDVHHGNATQHQFYDDPSVLYISLHRYDKGGFFPGSDDADADHTGTGAGQGFNVNIPWNFDRMGDPEYLAAFTQIVMPIAYQFAPELVLVSAGFDAAEGDPLGGYKLTPVAYAHMTHMLSALANGKVILALEGGYNLNSMSASMAACTSVLLGDPCPMAPLMRKPSDRALDTINKVLRVQKKFWPSLKFHAKIPEIKSERERHQAASPSQGPPRAQSARPSFDTPRTPANRPASSRPVGDAGRYASPSASLSDSSVTATTSGTGLSWNIPMTGGRHSAGQGQGHGQGARPKVGPQPTINEQQQQQAVTQSTSDEMKTSANALESGSNETNSAVSSAETEIPTASHPGVYVGTTKGGASAIMTPDLPVNPVREAVKQQVTALAAQLEAAHLSGADTAVALPDASTRSETPQPALEKKGPFRSSLYKDTPDPEPLLQPVDLTSPPIEKKKKSKRSKERRKKDGKKKQWVSAMASREVPLGDSQDGNAGVSGTAATLSSGDQNFSGNSGGDEEAQGACGGSARPNTVEEFLRMEGADQMFAVQPLTWCPHLTEVQPVPTSGLDSGQPCATCGDTSENWVCLTCFKVECSRYVQEHMLFHRLETEHNLALSYSDISVWCYACDQYVHNEAIFPHKNAAHVSKFGESLPGMA